MTALGRVLLVLIIVVSWSGRSEADEPIGVWDRSFPVEALEAHLEGGSVMIRFESDPLGLDAGYFVYRVDESSSRLSPLHEEMLPALPGRGRGAVIEVSDPYAEIGGPLLYVIVAVGVDGIERSFGPLTARASGDASAEEPGAGPIRDSRESSPRPAKSGEDERAPSSPERAEAGPRSGWADLRLRVEVEASGLHYLGAGELAEASGFSSERFTRALRRGQMRLESGEGEVAWLPARKGGGLYFYARTPGNAYSRGNVYWLSPGSGRIMAEIDGGEPVSPGVTSGPLTTRFEVDAMPVTVLRSSTPDDLYYWTYISAGHPTYGLATHEFEVDEGAVLSGWAVLEIDLQGLTSTAADPEHHAQVLVNSVALGAVSWDGALPHRARIELPAKILAIGANELTVVGSRLPGVPYSAFLVDGFDLTYDRWHRSPDGTALLFAAGAAGVQSVAGLDGGDLYILEISDPLEPRNVSGWSSETSAEEMLVSFSIDAPGGRFLATPCPQALRPRAIRSVGPSRLLEETSGAEYLIVSPRALRDGAEDLAAYRSGDGLSVFVADLDEIYDTFGGGLASPHAIRSFLAHARERWASPPRFVVLIGSGTFDHRDVEGFGDNLLPPYMAATPYGYYSWDGFYADLVGGDLVPDLALGRIPARTAEELSAYVEKLRRFERLGSGLGPDELVLLADNRDSGGNYPVESDALQPLVAKWASIERIYLSEQWIGLARARLAATLGSGAAWVNYVGHASVDRLAAEGLLTVQDVAAMPVNGRLPAVSAMACSVGRFEVPGWRSLAAELVLSPNGGAGAVFSASGQSLSSEARLLNRALFEALYSLEMETVGEAAAHALGAYSESGNFEFMLQIYNLLGDPAFRLR